MAEMTDIPRTIEIDSEVFGTTFVLRRRRVKDTFVISKRQFQLLDTSPQFASQQAQRVSFYVAELETVLVSPDHFDFENSEEEWEVERIAQEYEKWAYSFRDASTPGPATPGA